MTTPEPRLTSLAHGGGCGCKLAPAVLRDILKGMPLAGPFADLMVGTETSDDAAVWRLNDQQALVATTDFFMPVVDDPFHFGQIAATNALSDVYAMGGTPIFALALVGMPVNVLSTETIGRILQGGAEACRAAGIPVAGGHSIDSVEPIYGLVALGLVHPDQVLTNRGARPGDILLLTKGLGVGVLSAAFKQERLDKDGYAALKASTTQLNSLGAKLAGRAGVHAVTDVTGFGLLGHALEMARGAEATVEITADPPTLPGVRRLLGDGVRTGASARNWASYGEEVDLPDGLEDWRRDLLTDPQTSGGLLIAVAEAEADALRALARIEGFAAHVVGRVVEGPPRVRVVG
ncbi:MAG: selenide, water dikinase SelD [Alphaproteobacteria bacterium]|jgi:selenide, water dikinase|nr:selenide, water dikinase SelD [Alphaproteobacteria bacterium]MBU2042767.1 selenide, water dikinase SelD [Alphaproteobacteria bacterium]MBU2126505.1 selenide, water dikinase SelD [Alphaproteobacteria bacterium]MBU2209708.1 selenide, water dikinase SelD [Alphaproteobacteria bacterium]MBU2291322.1 selenide, water dikinase SelD [Alphaproteobacteria bacterium]